MKFGIIVNSTKPDIVESVVSFLERNVSNRNYQFILSSESEKFLSKSLRKSSAKHKLHSTDVNKFKGKIDYLISFGGDGTMLYSAHFAVKANVPLIGVNFGKLGFLADISFDELELCLETLKQKKAHLDERILLEGEFIIPFKKKFTALNDIVIDKGGWSRIIEIETSVDKKYLTTFSSDGLIISTPTGSTGYSLSTGGPILVPNLPALVLSPICPHTLTVRPIVVPFNSIIEITIQSAHKEIMINADGQQAFKLTPPVKIRIKKYKQTLKLVKKPNSDYFETLRKKLMWGIDLRKK